MSDERGYPGLFVVFEGIDGSGKLEQARRMQAYVQGRSKYNDVMMTHEPWRSEEIKRKLSRDKEIESDGERMAELFIDDRALHTKVLLRPTLAAGGIALCDRYKMSTCGYQWAQGVKLHTLLEMHEDRGILTPDITFLLDVGQECAERRRTSRGEPPEKYETRADFIKKLVEAYRCLGHMAQVDRKVFGRVEVINGEGSPEEVSKAVIAAFGPVYDAWVARASRNIGTLTVSS